MSEDIGVFLSHVSWSFISPEMTSVTCGPCEKGRPTVWLTQMAIVKQRYSVVQTRHQPGDHPHSDCSLCREQQFLHRVMCHQLVGAVGVIEKADGAENPEHLSWAICSIVVSHHRMTYMSLNGGNEPCCRSGYPVVCKGDNF